MDLSGAPITTAPIRRQQRFLQHVGKDAPTLPDEVDARRRRLPAKQTTQRLEILSGRGSSSGSRRR